MKWNDPEYLDAIEHIRKFFPESQRYVSEKLGIYFWAFLEAVKQLEANESQILEHSSQEIPADSTDAANENLYEHNAEIYSNLLLNLQLSPSGLAVVVPETLGADCYSNGVDTPFICEYNAVPEKLDKLSRQLGSNDMLFVYESGEVITVDHEGKCIWLDRQ